MNAREQQRAERKFREFKNNATEKDIEKIGSKIGSMNKGKLKEVWDKVILLWEFIKDPNAPWGLKAIAIGALLYVISPIDAIPDIIPIAGLVDDVSVVLAAVASLGMALNKYRK